MKRTKINKKRPCLAHLFKNSIFLEQSLSVSKVASDNFILQNNVHRHNFLPPLNWFQQAKHKEIEPGIGHLLIIIFCHGYRLNCCLRPTAEVPSNYLSCCSCCCSCSGHFVNLLCCMKSKHFSAKIIKLKLLV